MGYKGEQGFPLTLTAASVLERYRFVTVTAQVPAYAAAGGRVDGVTSVRGNANDYAVAVTPLAGIQKRFYVEFAGTVAVNTAVFATTDGKGIGVAGAAVATRAALDVTPTLGDVYYITNEGGYVQYTTSWVDVEPLGYAAEAAVAGSHTAVDAVLYAKQTRDQGFGAKIVYAGKTASETDADAAVIVTDSRFAAGDVAVASVLSSAVSVYPKRVSVGAGLCTISLSGNGGAGTIVNLIVARTLDV